MKMLHMSLSVRGALRWPDNLLVALFPGCNAEEAREQLLIALEDGWSVLPMGDCDGFDKVTGCPGHRETAKESAT